ncbi:type II toxin-antitoxin system RelE/ParE family toxin [Mucilaginibacter myungsuensis]|uniref:Type II toxin-antitoxin system RelE/ParE family toxin n=1 Tax=Mucilaginibacter myungsuensis TaxID=649104 RepID=A0A929PZ57_9SPHI|nr:type II toxin-antitoxin system RelE/ParE family toxin [Mucilaginibacter myungsuensis]MBE9664057.1 type II toxin-antitoxin system RelE/ParE family toxin [Mucilaginibacter myungsuensis]MDN3601235.1 type II toxin-antitoxin system RelE/ParE family toxin [Mucilaginibacter myungsuensis]
MSYKVDLTIKATKELQEAYDWYEGRRNGLGDRFMADFNKKADFISNNAVLFAVKIERKGSKYREVLLDVFPFLVVYEVLEEEKIVRVFSVFNTSRHPKRKLK